MQRGQSTAHQADAATIKIQKKMTFDSLYAYAIIFRRLLPLRHFDGESRGDR